MSPCQVLIICYINARRRRDRAGTLDMSASPDYYQLYTVDEELVLLDYTAFACDAQQKNNSSSTDFIVISVDKVTERSKVGTFL